jgi:hypothetical protein
MYNLVNSNSETGLSEASTITFDSLSKNPSKAWLSLTRCQITARVGATAPTVKWTKAVIIVSMQNRFLAVQLLEFMPVAEQSPLMRGWERGLLP